LQVTGQANENVLNEPHSKESYS